MKGFTSCFAILMLCFIELTAAVSLEKKLKLLVVTDKFPWASRPFINNQIAGLLEKGHDVFVLATSRLKENKKSFCLQSCQLEKRVFYEQLPQSHRIFDVILIQFPQSPGNVRLLNLYKRGELQGKLVFFFRGEDLSAMIKGNSHIYDWMFKRGALFLPVCEYFKEKLIALGCNSKKIEVIHSAIDCEQFAYQSHHIKPDQKIRLLTACRLVPKKGVKFGILTAVKLHARYPKLTYTIVGEGPEKNRLLQLIEVCEAEKYIHLKGKLPHDDMAKELQKADIFILSSVTAVNGDQEGIPNALMEAMASGLPVVSSYHAGIPELIEHGTRGLLALERDVATLAQNIVYFIEHQEECEQITQRARAYVELAHKKEIENDKLEQLLLHL